MSDSFKAAFVYRLFFLYVEPLSALVGAYYAAGKPTTYLELLSPSPSGSGYAAAGSRASATIDTPTLATLYQLANLYLLFAINEHYVLSSSSSSSSLRTWRTLLVGLLIADFGHLATMIPVAMGQKGKGFGEVFLKWWEWNAMEWGSVGFVYVGAGMRMSFLMGVGVRKEDRLTVPKGGTIVRKEA
ncbi:hypothetical protein BC835DRAFT_1407580 [Cytidiella melzeri]|nr:hypothetical protein BC835DRAFT_1407580 [Cytidiella melzeri]